MRTTFDFSPLYHSSVGFERLLNAADASSRVGAVEGWPAYDIAKLDENDYRISIAVAGFSQDDLTITQEQNLLTVEGRKSGEDESEYLHRGIPSGGFKRQFELADHVDVADATLFNGLLTIDLKRDVPEEFKPRRIEIAAGKSSQKTEMPQIGGKKKAA